MGKQATTSQNNKKTQTRYQPTTTPTSHTHTQKGKKINYSWMLSKNDREKEQRHPQPSIAGERPPGTRPASSILAIPVHLSLLGCQLVTVTFLQQDAEPKGQLSRVTWLVTRGWGGACKVCERIMSPASEEQRHQQLYYCCSAVGSIQYLHFHLVYGYYPT